MIHYSVRNRDVSLPLVILEGVKKKKKKGELLVRVEGEFFSPGMFKERDLGEIVGFLFFFLVFEF